MTNIMKALFRRNAVLAAAGFACLAFLAVLLGLAAVDDTIITGANRWMKPSKFALSIAVYLLTLAWLFGELKGRRALLFLLALSISGAMVMEQVLITLQAARGVTSHYNNAAPFDAAIFLAMGWGVVVNTLSASVLLLLFTMRQPQIDAAYLWGIRLGLLVFVLGSLEGVLMLVNSAHTVGGPDGGPGVPLINWSTAHGDLRIAHFLGIHALQAFPLAGFALDRLVKPATFRLALLALFCAAYSGVTAWTLAVALSGRPLLAL